MTEERHTLPLTALPVQLVDQPSGLILRRGNTEIEIEGEFYAQITILVYRILTERRVTLPELLRHFADRFHEPVTQLVKHLLDKRLLRHGTAAPADAGDETPEQRFHWHFEQNPAPALAGPIVLAGVNALSVALHNKLLRSGIDAPVFVDDPLLRAMEFANAENGLALDEVNRHLTGGSACVLPEVADPAALVIAAAPFGGLTLLNEWNHFAVSRGLNFLPVSLTGQVGKIGPLVRPPDTPCLACLTARENSHLQEFEAVRTRERSQALGQQVLAYHGAMLEVLAETAAFEVIRFLRGIPGSLAGRMLTLSLLGQETRSHRVLKAPRCPSCSSLRGVATLNLHERLSTDEMWEALERTGGYRHGA